MNEVTSEYTMDIFLTLSMPSVFLRACQNDNVLFTTSILVYISDSDAIFFWRKIIMVLLNAIL